MTEPWIITTSVRVRYADTDKMGVMYYGRYMELFEVGRTEWIRACWRPYVEIEREGVLLPVVHAAATYRQSFHYDDLIQIRTFPVGIQKARIRFGYELFGDNDQQPRIIGLTEHAFVDESGKTVRIPSKLAQLLSGRVPEQLTKFDLRDHLLSSNG